MARMGMLRWLRRSGRARAEAHDEAQFLVRRYGPQALDVAHAKLAQGDLTSWGRRVMRLAIAELRRDRGPRDPP